MLREAQNFLAIQPSLAVTIGVTVSAIILGLNLLGDALSDYYDTGGK
jgi:ABC-type dipeptide/oligopeptide/nickel transport system permease subunit